MYLWNCCQKSTYSAKFIVFASCLKCKWLTGLVIQNRTDVVASWAPHLKIIFGRYLCWMFDITQDSKILCSLPTCPSAFTQSTHSIYLCCKNERRHKITAWYHRSTSKSQNQLIQVFSSPSTHHKIIFLRYFLFFSEILFQVEWTLNQQFYAIAKVDTQHTTHYLLGILVEYMLVVKHFSKKQETRDQRRGEPGRTNSLT